MKVPSSPYKSALFEMAVPVKLLPKTRMNVGKDNYVEMDGLLQKKSSPPTTSCQLRKLSGGYSPNLTFRVHHSSYPCRWTCYFHPAPVTLVGTGYQATLKVGPEPNKNFDWKRPGIIALGLYGSYPKPHDLGRRRNLEGCRVARKTQSAQA